jgi:porin-like protein/outer membrane DcaP-like protein
MARTRNIGRVTALGGVTAAIAVLTGLPEVSADELADLRANQELLQRRIDQLAQAQPPAPGGTPGGGIAGAMGAQAIPGQSIVGGSFPRSFLIPGTETSIRLGGFIDITASHYLQGGGGRNGANNSSTVLQNGTLESIPLGQMFVPGLGSVAQSAQHSRGNNIFEFSPNQSRINIETRTPTAWGESRTFFEFDWSGCNNFSCQTLQQGGGDSLVPRLRFAYGTLGGFLAGQAISNFSDADADTESMEFGGSIGSTGGYRVPQVRYTLAGPWGSAWSVSAEQPHTAVLTPAGVLGSDTVTTALPGGPGAPVIPIGPCNGVPCTGTGVVPGTTTAFNPARAQIPNFTFASYWAQPWGHVDFAALLNPLNYNDGKFIDRTFLGYGGHISGDVKPGWFGWSKDDFLFSFVAGDGIGNYASGGEATLIPMATNFTVTTACATPQPGCAGGMAASNIIFKPVFGYSANGGYQHWWTPNLRSTFAAGFAHQDVSSQLIGPTQAISNNKELWNAFVNLVWNPVAFITTGVQYMYGKRTVISNAKGTENVLIGKFRVAF